MRYITTHDAPRTGIPGLGDHSWHARGLCHGMDPSESDRLFFPRSTRSITAIAQAKELCGRCPVRTLCLNSALDTEARHGIWGGLTEGERRPYHEKVDKRLDYARVRAVLQGRDVHLSPTERTAVARHAYVRGWSADRLAWLLSVEHDTARDLLRDAHNHIADRDRCWDSADRKKKKNKKKAKRKKKNKNDGGVDLAELAREVRREALGEAA
ncbi:WhiB family transcriptional regulator [Streptomyces sp. URMC 125]|uniref:WhiB family transcriptional regulator n=1 Tax=Streptomyces sp. URMC 125 TaxID=3423419 RepID=UPI003F1C33D5